MNAGDVIFNFEGNTAPLEKETNNLSTKMSSVAKGIGSAFTTGVTIASTALVGFIGTSIKMAGDLEQQIGGTEAVFGDFANTIQDKASEAFKTAGMSANDYMATINKMGSLMQGSGIDQETSMNLSADAMQRAADVASIMGIDTASAMEAITGAAKGNFTINKIVRYISDYIVSVCERLSAVYN